MSKLMGIKQLRLLGEKPTILRFGIEKFYRDFTMSQEKKSLAGTLFPFIDHSYESLDQGSRSFMG